MVQSDETHGESGLSSQLPTEPVERRRLTIGIPTVKRRDGDYFMDMLGSMLNKTSTSDLREIIFVVFLADIENIEWKKDIESRIKTKYSKFLVSGSLKVIQAPVSFYDAMVAPKNNSYLYWRTKQNYDYAYLMKQTQHLSELYMQMEDDVIAADGYYDAINEYIRQQNGSNWVCLEYSSLGFIGKLYHTKHLNALADMLVMFSEHQPVDYTFMYFNILSGQGYRAIRKPTLFQHMGYHSSLAEKIQPLKDNYFNFPPKKIFGHNPPATIFTSFVVSPDYPPELAYSKEPGFFWSGAGAKAGDTFTLVFESPQEVSRITVQTGTKDHESDFVHEGVLEASASVKTGDSVSQCEEPVVLSHFQSGEVNVTQSDIALKMGLVKMKCLQVRITATQNEWVIIREIAVFVKRNGL